MEKLVTQTTETPPRVTAPRANRGRFQPGDPRINRAGRPKADLSGFTWDRAPRADRLKRFHVHARKFLHRFSSRLGPWIVNFPPDVGVVGCHFNEAESVLVLVLRSSSFERIAR